MPVSLSVLSLCFFFCRKELESLGDGKKKAKSADKEQDMTAEEKNHVEVAKEYSAQNKEDQSYEKSFIYLCFLVGIVCLMEMMASCKPSLPGDVLSKGQMTDISLRLSFGAVHGAYQGWWRQGRESDLS